MKSRLFLFWSLLAFGIDASAQLENHIWFFGNSTTGIKFDSISNAPSQHNVQFTPYGSEGCGVVVDPITGQLLFYSDGERVLNRNHVVMANGNGLGGCASSSQAVAMIQVPDSCHKYYIFSNSVGSGCSDHNLTYSIINMQANGGLGEVELATKGTLIHDNVKEAMIAINRSGTTDSWLIATTNTSPVQFLVFSVTSTGVISTDTFNIASNCSYSYCMNYSPISKKVAVACAGGQTIAVMDFNDTTGVLDSFAILPNSQLQGAYDVEWSPDGNMLYYSSWSSVQLRQYDFISGLTTTIYSTNTNGGGLRTGPDGYIYHITSSGASFLSRIINPNIQGTGCNYLVNDYNCGGPIGTLNLPEVLAAGTKDIGLSTIIDHVDCYGAYQGELEVIASGGTNPYSYEWSQGSLADTAADLNAGLYFVTVEDAFGCKNSTSAVVQQPDSIAIVADSVVNVSCNSGNNGSIIISVSGGLGAYSYNWSSGDSTMNVSGLGAGTYDVTVTDSVGCQKSLAVSVTQPGSLNINNIDLTHVTCNGNSNGTIEIHASGGTLPYSFTIDGVNFQPDSSFQNLTGGSYNITVIDAGGCSYFQQVQIVEPAALSLSVSSQTDVDCNGNSNGTVTLQTTGGSSPFQYSLDGVNYQASPTFSGLTTGPYTFTVVDDSSCTATAQVNILEPPVLDVAVSGIANIPCFGDSTGFIFSFGSGGVIPYTFAIDTSLQPDGNFTNLFAGSYVITITDSSGCMDTVVANITQQTQVVPSIVNVVHADCFGSATGELEFSASGGTNPYQYSLDGVNFQASNLFTSLPADSHQLTVQDANGCDAILWAVVNQPSGISASILNQTSPMCFGENSGNVELSANGGSLPFQFAIDGGINQSSPLFDSLYAGNHTVVITDSFGCDTTLSFTISEPAELSVGIMITDSINCYGGTDGALLAQSSGGTPAYTFLWSTSPGQTDSVASNLSVGNYNVSVTDANNCTVTASYTIDEPSLMSAQPSAVDVSCFGFDDGSVLANVSGGTGSYSYSWGHDSSYVSSNPTDLQAGLYAFTATDQNGCVVTESITVQEPLQIMTWLPDTHWVNLGQSVMLDLEFAPFGTYAFDWSPQQGLICSGAIIDCEDPAAQPPSNTEFMVLLLDQNGCEAYDTTLVIVNPAPTIFIPNAFSPNDDGRNDFFQIYSKGATKMLMEVYNRWGEKVFETTDIEGKWDGTFNGKTVDPGVYVYSVYLEYLGAQSISRAGSVTLLK